MERAWCSLSEATFGNQVYRLAQVRIIPVHLSWGLRSWQHWVTWGWGKGLL